MTRAEVVIAGRKINVAAALADMGDPSGYLPHTRLEFLLASFPRIAPPPEGKGRSKGARRDRGRVRRARNP